MSETTSVTDISENVEIYTESGDDSPAGTAKLKVSPQSTPKSNYSAQTRSIKGNNDPAIEENYDDEPDETLEERIWGLTEMFPDVVRNFCGNLFDLSTSTVKNFYQFSCNASWIFFTSSMILFAPVIFETERAQMEEMQKTQQKQVLLGPGSAMSSSGNPGVPSLPPMTR